MPVDVVMWRKRQTVSDKQQITVTKHTETNTSILRLQRMRVNAVEIKTDGLWKQTTKLSTDIQAHNAVHVITNCCSKRNTQETRERLRSKREPTKHIGHMHITR